MRGSLLNTRSVSSGKAPAHDYSSVDFGFRVTVIGEDEIKVTTDSAGIATPLLPVSAAPAVPAPAPTNPPISAPLPPPASPPIKAPPPAPPPTIAPVRLPLPLTVCSNSCVVTAYPPIRLSCIPRSPSPLNLPCFLAATTVPLTGVPAFSTVTPWTRMDWASDPLNVSPTLLVLELRSWEIRTVSAVPLGTVYTLGAGGGGGGGGVGAAVCVGAGAGSVAGAVAVGAGAWSGAGAAA